MFDNVINVQNDGVAMSSPLGTVQTDISMIESETSFIPELTDQKKFWKRYVDDTICFMKAGSINYMLSVLNSFDVILNLPMSQNMKINYHSQMSFMQNGKRDLYSCFRNSFQQ